MKKSFQSSARWPMSVSPRPRLRSWRVPAGRGPQGPGGDAVGHAMEPGAQ